MIATGCVALFVFSVEPIVEGRPVKGSQYEQISVSAVTETPAEHQAQVIWAMSSSGATRESMIAQHTVISDGETSRLYYEVINVPPVAQRDYVLRVTLRQAGESFVIEYRTEDNEAYPVKDGKVRMQVRATCTVSPRTEGGSQIRYDMHTEFGGDIPAWMVKEPQRRSIVEAVKKMVESGRVALATR